MRTRVLFSFLLLASISMFGCKDSSSTEETPQRTYRIGTVHWAAFSPLNVADSIGFWTDEGVKVEVINYKSNTDLNADLDNKKIDIALDMIGSWLDLKLQGHPITILGETDWSHGGDKIIMKQGVNIDTATDKRFGLYLNLLSVKNFVAKYLATKGKLLNDFNLIEVSDPDSLADKFVSGDFWIEANYDPSALRAVSAGNGTVVATSADFPGCIPEGFAGLTDVIENIPHEDLVAIFRGWKRAVEWENDPANWTTFASILRTKTFQGDGPFTDAELKSMLANVRIHSRADQSDKNKAGGEMEQFVTELLQFAKSNGYTTTGVTAVNTLNTSALMEALAP